MMILTCDYQSSNFIHDVKKSFIETGFAVVTNHGLDADFLSAVYLFWSDFFNSPNKNEYKFKPETQFGYFPFKTETAKGQDKADLKEFYHFFYNRPNSFEQMPTGLYIKSAKIFTDLEDIGLKILERLEVVTPFYQKNNSHWARNTQESSQTLLRILHYPPLERPMAGVRAAAHEDINLITLLPAATNPGLQIKDLNGEWNNVPVSPGSLVINVGDMLQELTNGYYKSTTHQVVNPEGKEERMKPRYSMPLFMHPNENYRLSPRHTAKTYLNERLKELGLL